MTPLVTIALKGFQIFIASQRSFPVSHVIPKVELHDNNNKHQSCSKNCPTLNAK